MRSIASWMVVLIAAMAGLAAVRVELQDSRRTAAADAAPPARPALPPSETSARAADTASRAPTRDLTEYGDVTTPPPVEAPPRTFGGIPLPDADEAPGAASAPPPPRAMLVGLIRRPTGAEGVFSLDGVVELAGAGTEVRGWQVLTLNVASESAQVRSPEGEVIDLALGSPPPSAQAAGDGLHEPGLDDARDDAASNGSAEPDDEP